MFDFDIPSITPLWSMCSNHVTDFNEVVAVVVRKKRQEKEESDTCLEKIPVSRLF